MANQKKTREKFYLTSPEPGDYGKVIASHAQIYAKEYGFNLEFELLVAQIVVRFIEKFDPTKQACWIAKSPNGEFLGSVFLVKQSKTIAKLRLLIVVPEARGLGLGARLVDEVISHAKALGYKKIVLWTNDVLHAALHIYVQRGFKLVKEEKHHNFGRTLVGQNWELIL
jgi:N-acetylglutamate synthase-like GNAT family acetyltransferase